MMISDGSQEDQKQYPNLQSYHKNGSKYKEETK